MSFNTMMQMHYPTFFKYVREVEEKARKEQPSNNQGNLPSEVEGARLANVAGRPVMWGGETVDVR
jgi:hypothetical protein